MGPSLATLLAATRTAPARVLLVHPDPATRQRLTRLLTGQVVGEAASVDGALEAVAALAPTVIVTAAALEAEGGAGLRLAAETTIVDPNVQTVLYVDGPSPELRAAAKRQAVLVIGATERPSALLLAVRAAHDVYEALAGRRAAAPPGQVQAGYPPGNGGAGVRDAGRPG